MAQATVTPCTNLSKKYWDLSLFRVTGSLEYTLQGRASLSWCDGPGVPRHRAPAARQAAAGRGSVVLGRGSPRGKAALGCPQQFRDRYVDPDKEHLGEHPQSPICTFRRFKLEQEGFANKGEESTKICIFSSSFPMKN